jgi:hypothetical protein
MPSEQLRPVPLPDKNCFLSLDQLLTRYPEWLSTYLNNSRRCRALIQTLLDELQNPDPLLTNPRAPQFKMLGFQWQLETKRFGYLPAQTIHIIRRSFIGGLKLNPKRVVWDEEFELKPKTAHSYGFPEPYGWGLNYQIHHCRISTRGNVKAKIATFPNSVAGAERLELVLDDLGKAAPVTLVGGSPKAA